MIGRAVQRPYDSADVPALDAISAAAVVNAIHHATGIRVRDLPVDCDALLGEFQRRMRGDTHLAFHSCVAQAWTAAHTGATLDVDRTRRNGAP